MPLSVSLQALRAFEAAARHSSFKRAAEELALTPTAISHHISKLEDRLNVCLFERRPRQVRLTDTGQQLAKATTEGFAKIERALADIQQLNEVVQISTTSSFAAQVLLPAQHTFSATYPDVSIQILSGEQANSHPYSIPVRLGNIQDVAIEDRLNVEQYNVFTGADMTALQTPSTRPVLYTTRWKNPALCKPPLETWLASNALNRDNFVIREFDQELFGIQQAVAQNALVFCSELLVRGMCSSGLLQPVRGNSVTSELCYYIPNKAGFRTPNAMKFIAWLEGLM
ncbi:LysR family transcriptional regulator [Pseudoalteromonas sp. DL2-H2.2]|uniref:LysR family transcriptional regulator n=1 Tax=Pseudoalteromonas sp. DL2-H2.2 TaxID=2908889 RepID=UPI001F1735CB|nr:LysR family transcriptional regulator [Pseudoalteromonas sp. DL2-H2.2]MCF2909795.1 LysR family transcriptional regulator [Pseudoalteromonas sp. DL2-H2.2]